MARRGNKRMVWEEKKAMEEEEGEPWQRDRRKKKGWVAYMAERMKKKEDGRVGVWKVVVVVVVVGGCRRGCRVRPQARIRMGACH